jgi:hypothetical protein
MKFPKLLGEIGLGGSQQVQRASHGESQGNGQRKNVGNKVEEMVRKKMTRETGK